MSPRKRRPKKESARPNEPMPAAAAANRHYRESTYREMIAETLFLGKLLQHLWSINAPTAEVLRSMRDNGGYDLVINCNGVTRFIQLKGMTRRKAVRVHQRLAEKAGACVIGMILDSESLAIKEFLWLGSSPNQKIANFKGFREARALHHDRNGQKPIKENVKIVPLNEFCVLKNLSLLTEKLFRLRHQKTSNHN